MARWQGVVPRPWGFTTSPSWSLRPNSLLSFFLRKILRSQSCFLNKHAGLDKYLPKGSSCHWQNILATDANWICLPSRRFCLPLPIGGHGSWAVGVDLHGQPGKPSHNSFTGARNHQLRAPARAHLSSNHGDERQQTAVPARAEHIRKGRAKCRKGGGDPSFQCRLTGLSCFQMPAHSPVNNNNYLSHPTYYMSYPVVVFYMYYLVSFIQQQFTEHQSCAGHYSRC